MQNGEPSGDFRFGLPRSFGDMALTRAIQNLRVEFPEAESSMRSCNGLEYFWSALQITSSTPQSSTYRIMAFHRLRSLDERIDTKPVCVVAGKTRRFSQPVTLEELSASPWVVNPAGMSDASTTGGGLIATRFAV